MLRPIAIVVLMMVPFGLLGFALSLLQTTSHGLVIYRCPTCGHAERCQRVEREAWYFRCNECERSYSTWDAEPIEVGK